MLRKGTTKEVVEIPKNHMLSYLYGLAAAVFFGSAGVCSAELSKLGLISMFGNWIGVLLPWTLYHGFYFITAKCKGEDYLVWEKSMYVIEVKDEENPDADAEYFFSIDRFLWMFSRGIVELCI